MKRKDKHINKFLHASLPDPEIPADDAWLGMSDMLDAPSNQGVNGTTWPSQLWKSIGKLKGLLIATSAVVIVSAVIALVIFNNDKTRDLQTASSNIPSEHQNTAGTVNATGPVNQKTKTTIQGGNTANELRTPDSLTNQVKVGYQRIEKGNRLEKQVPEHIASRRIAAHSANPANTPLVRTFPHTRRRHAYSSVTREPDAYVRSQVRESQRDNAFPDVPVQSANARDAKKPTEFPVTDQTVITPVSHEKTTAAPAAESTLNSLESLPGHFNGAQSDLSKLVQKPVSNVTQPAPKKQNTLFTNLHFGPEWNINRSFVSTSYMLTGADSVKHPLRLAIPGVFVSKSWKRHTATFIFNPVHSYFGDKARVAQRIDTLANPDSTFQKVNRNTNFIKAFGLNFSLQYQYQITRGLSVIGGLSYARYSSALLRKESDYTNGVVVEEAYLTARGQEALKSYINPGQWNIRVGILFYSPSVFKSRLQVGMNTLIPVSNLSLAGFNSVKSPNVQMSIRFLVR
jgi:hypothetical protein